MDNKTYLEIFNQSFKEREPFRFKLKHLSDPALFDRFLQKPLDLFSRFRKVLWDELKFDLENKERIEREEIRPEYLHIIADPTGFEKSIPAIEDFSINLSKYTGKFIIARGKFMNIGLERENHVNELEFECLVCGHKFSRPYKFDIVTNRYHATRKCQNCDTSNCLTISKSDDFERRGFVIEDTDVKNINQFILCRILRNVGYFIEKEKGIDLNEEIEVFGILKRDFSDFFTMKQNKEFPYYIDTYDIQIKKSKIIDERIIEKLREKLKKPSYNEKLLDATNPLTYLIDLFFPTKQVSAMSLVTGGSWNKIQNIRDTLNSLIGSGGGTYKSSIQRDLQNIVGARNYYRFEGNKITEAGLIGTTERKDNLYKPVIRYGILALYSDGTICFDEAQEIVKEKMHIFNILRCVEDGHNGSLQDAINFRAACWESIIIVQNYLTEDGFFDPHGTLIENLGWAKENAESLLQRFDLYYDIPEPDVYTKTRVHRNLMNMQKEEGNKIVPGKLFYQIADELEITDYDIPERINNIKEQINFILFNYILKAKEIYRQSRVPNEIDSILGQLYEDSLKLKGFKSSKITLRAKNTALKVLRALAALRLSDRVEMRDFNYFKQNCMKLIIPFRESEILQREGINMEQIFKKTFKNNVLLNLGTDSQVSIEDHIQVIRAYIKNNYYKEKTDDDFNNEIDDYMPAESNLGQNWDYRKLLENNMGWIEKQRIIVEKIKRKGTFFKPANSVERLNLSKRDKYNSEDLELIIKENNFGEEDAEIVLLIFENIKSVSEHNNYKGLDDSGLKQILSLQITFSDFLYKETIKLFLKHGILEKEKKKYVLSESWR